MSSHFLFWRQLLHWSTRGGGASAALISSRDVRLKNRQRKLISDLVLLGALRFIFVAVGKNLKGIYHFWWLLHKSMSSDTTLCFNYNWTSLMGSTGILSVDFTDEKSEQILSFILGTKLKDLCFRSYWKLSAITFSIAFRQLGKTPNFATLLRVSSAYSSDMI